MEGEVDKGEKVRRREEILSGINHAKPCLDQAGTLNFWLDENRSNRDFTTRSMLQNAFDTSKFERLKYNVYLRFGCYGPDYPRIKD